MMISTGAIISWFITVVVFIIAFYKSSKAESRGYMDLSIIDKILWYGGALIISMLTWIISLNVGS